MKPLAVIAVALMAMCALGGVMIFASEDSEAKTCPTCGGSGTVTCSNCDGTGVVEDMIGDGTCPSCGGSGYNSCSTCGGSGTVADPHTHSYSPTDYDYGKCSGCVTTYTCSCGDSYTSGTKYDSHNYVSQGTVYGDCSGSKTTYKCSRCGDTYSTGTIYDSHSWGSWTTTKTATCTETGTQKHTCSRCSDTETKTIPATGHSWQIDGYTWSSDFSKCTVGFKCAKNSSHTGSEIVNSTSTTDGNSKTYSVSGKSSAYGVSYSATKTVYTSTLNFNANGGTGAPSALTYTGTTTSAHTFTIPSTKPTKADHDFLGWSENSTATSASYSPGATISVPYNGSKMLYAVWKESAVDRGEIAWNGIVKIVVNETSKLTLTAAKNNGAYMQAVSGPSWVTYDTERGSGLVTAKPTSTGLYDLTVKLVVPGLQESDMPIRYWSSTTSTSSIRWTSRPSRQPSP